MSKNFKVLQVLLSIALVVTPTSMAWSDNSGAKPAVSSDINNEKNIDLHFDYGQLDVKPSYLQTQIGAGTQSTPQM
jgi:hypothetical protein